MPPSAENGKRTEFQQDFIKATEEYEASLKKLSEAYADDLKRLTEQNAKLKDLYADGLISRRDMEASEASVAARWWRATVSSLTTATLAPGRKVAIRCPSEASNPRPMKMS